MLCYHTGAWLAQQGWTLRTGAARGADQAFAEGALDVGGRVVLCVPDTAFQYRWVEPARGRGAERKVLLYPEADLAHMLYFYSVDRFHKKPHLLSTKARRLHARNAMILDCPAMRFVLAWPKRNRWGGLGGTGQGIEIAEACRIEVIRLDLPHERARVESRIGRSL